jgi:restriction system protein
MARSRIASVEYEQRRKELEHAAAEARRAERAARKRRAEQAAQQYFADRAAEAGRRSRALADRVAELRGILAYGRRRNPRIDLMSLRTEFSPPAPDLGAVGWRALPPDWSRFEPPPPSMVGRLAGAARYRQQLATAREAYAAARAEYERAEAERRLRFDEARRRYATELADERRRVEDHNRAVDAFAAALRRREPGAVGRYLAMVLDATPLPDGFPRTVEVAWPAGDDRPVVRVELPGRDVVPAVAAVGYDRPRDELRELPRPADEVAALHRRVVAEVVLLFLRDAFAADPALAAVTLVGHVRGAVLVRVGAVRTAVEELLARDLPPEVALSTLDARNDLRRVS